MFIALKALRGVICLETKTATAPRHIACQIWSLNLPIRLTAISRKTIINIISEIIDGCK